MNVDAPPSRKKSEETGEGLGEGALEERDEDGFPNVKMQTRDFREVLKDLTKARCIRPDVRRREGNVISVRPDSRVRKRVVETTKQRVRAEREQKW